MFNDAVKFVIFFFLFINRKLSVYEKCLYLSAQLGVDEVKNHLHMHTVNIYHSLFVLFFFKGKGLRCTQMYIFC